MKQNDEANPLRNWVWRFAFRGAPSRLV